MPDVQVEGPEAIAIDKLAHLVALCPTFQNGRNWSTAMSESVDYLVRENEINERNPVRPFAIVDSTNDDGWDLSSGGAQHHLLPSGTLWLWLEVGWSPLYVTNEKNALRTGLSTISKIVKEIADNAGKDVSPEVGGPWIDGSGDLPIVSIRRQIFDCADPQKFTNPNDRWIAAGYLVRWSLEG